MPSNDSHIIRQQYLHVALNGTESDGLALQRSLPDVCRNWLMPAIERALERCAPSDGHVYVERLEIDAGTLTLERLESDLPESVARALEQALREQLPQGGWSLPSVDGNIWHMTTQHSVHEAFLSFLTTGRLPWWFRLPAGKSLEAVMLSSWLEEAKPGATDRSTLDAVSRLLDFPPVRERLILQFSRPFLETILGRLSPEAVAIVVSILETLRNSAIPQESVKEFERRLWERVLATIPAGLVPLPRSLVGEAWSSFSGGGDQQAGLGHALEQHWSGVTNKAPTSRTTDFHLTPPRLPGPQHPLIDRVEQPDQRTGPNPRPSSLPSLRPSSRRSAIPPRSEERGGMAARSVAEEQKFSWFKEPRPSGRGSLLDRVEQPEAREGLYIDNAGLVLLHPFLPQLFSSLGIAVDDRLIRPERALCLLHYLATGQTVAPEYALVLPKILCHVSLDWPVESDVELTTAEQEEAVALLESVIHHWEALRNTSPDGLRGTFLLRSGKVLMREDGDWVLQVEANTADILLDQLPWGISMIKLPWMRTMLWVEWR